MVLGDIGTALAAVALAWTVAPGGTRFGPLAALTIATLTWPVVLTVRGLYGFDAVAARGESAQVIRGLVVFLAILALGGAVLGRDVSNVSFLVAAGVLLSGSVVVRVLADRQLKALRRNGDVVTRTLAVGLPAQISTLVDQLAGGTEHPFVVVGACVEGDGAVVEDVPTVARLTGGAPEGGTLYDDPQIRAVVAAIDQVRADTVCVVPGSSFTGPRLRALSWALADRDVRLVAAMGMIDTAPHRLDLAQAGSATLVNVRSGRSNRIDAIKAVADRLGAGAGLLLLSPVFVLVALAVRLTSSGPVFYRQRRIGRGGRPFTMVKFRTMYADAEARRAELAAANEHDGLMFKMRADPRITRVGRWLRRASLDELPQLFNVIGGDMSLVGPRPPLPDEVARYSSVERRRLRVQPGMTGLWQVSGRSNLSWDESIRLDLWYVDNWRLAEDARLLGRTANAVARGTGAY